ncbi:hypothetical protein KIPB_001181 [Kipferlia bialata]|uniref:Heat shock protein 70 family n=1 Tax=Kipferlia bialata TaxID=797122 RepID=A0A9K3CNE3_9EUKA|nr:hypothetical protein KIPB_001181 [Kipferlia bialata]|eukprot:g1181.t1
MPDEIMEGEREVEGGRGVGTPVKGKGGPATEDVPVEGVKAEQGGGEGEKPKKKRRRRKGKKKRSKGKGAPVPPSIQEVEQAAHKEALSAYGSPISQCRYSKTNTELVYEMQPDGGWVATQWGFEAHKGASTAALGPEEGVMHVKNFRLLLDPDSPSAGGTDRARIQLPPGKTVVNVLADYLRFMTQHSMKVLHRAYTVSSFSVSDVMWCIAVPARWRGRAWTQMREAATEAGLVSSPNSPRLHLVAEAEAALVYMDSLGNPEFLSNAMQRLAETPFRTREGEVTMVVDAGATSVDITTYRKAGPGTDALMHRDRVATLVSSAYDVTSDMTLSECVDLAFRDWVVGKVSLRVVEEMERDRPGAMYHLYDQWRMERRFDVWNDKDYDDHYIRLSGSMLKCIESHLAEEDVFARLGAEQDGEEDDLVLCLKDRERMFDPTVERILALIRKEMHNQSHRHSVGSILLIGGFAQFPYLKHRVQAELGQDVRVVWPKSPATVVMGGACQYALTREGPWV